MLRIDLIAVGKMRAGPFAALWDEYKTRLPPWTLTLTELEGRSAAEEHEKILGRLDPQAFIFILDEKGKSLPSRDFAARLDKLAAEGRPHIQFVIGGADGLSDEIRKKAHFLLSFGNQTWPHMLARIMVVEQIYRARQIIAGHPYHRD